MKKLLIAIILIVAVAATVWHRTAKADTLPNAFCPDVSDVHKNPVKGNWTSQQPDGSWQSYDRSFATSLTKFAGAQWSGANVGQLTCIYNSEQQFTMEGKPVTQQTIPVLLVFHTLTFEPSGGKWQKVQKNGRFIHGLRNCYSLKQSDCPFKINAKPPVGNIYQEAESLKTEAPDNTLQPPSN